MSLLDSWTVLFEADTSKAEAGLQKTDRATADIIQLFQKADKAAADMGDGTAKAANQGGAALDGMGESAAGAGSKIGVAAAGIVASLAGILSVGEAIRGIFETTAELVQIGRTANALGMDPHELDAITNTLVVLGADAQGARDSLTDMAESIGDALQDTEGSIAKSYQSMGVSLKDAKGGAIDATEGLLRLADAASKLSNEEAIFRIKEVGITDNRTVEAVLKGRKELERLLAVERERSRVTQEGVEKAEKFQAASRGLQSALDAMGISLTVGLLPGLTDVADTLAAGVDWLRSHKELVVGFFTAVAAAVAAYFLPAMASAAVATLAAVAPFALIIGLVAAIGAAFALAYEDVMSFLDGGDSLIGTFLQAFPAVGDAVRTVIGMFREGWEAAKAFGAQLADAVAPLGASFGEVFGSIGSLIGEFMGLLGELASLVWSAIGSDVVGAFQTMGTAVGSVISTLSSALSGLVGLIGTVAGGISGAVSTVAGWVGGAADSVKEARGQIADASAAPGNSQTSAAISNSANYSRSLSVSVGEVNVQTRATDAAGMAGAAHGALTSQLRQVEAEFSNGVDR